MCLLDLFLEYDILETLPHSEEESKLLLAATKHKERGDVNEYVSEKLNPLSDLPHIATYR